MNPGALSEDPILEAPRERLVAETVAHHRPGDGGYPSGGRSASGFPGRSSALPNLDHPAGAPPQGKPTSRTAGRLQGGLRLCRAHKSWITGRRRPRGRRDFCNRGDPVVGASDGARVGHCRIADASAHIIAMIQRRWLMRETQSGPDRLLIQFRETPSTDDAERVALTRSRAMCRLMPGEVVGQPAELLKKRDVVANGEVLGDEACVVERQYVDVTRCGEPMRRGGCLGRAGRVCR